jgi:hypothetical protein
MLDVIARVSLNPDRLPSGTAALLVKLYRSTLCAPAARAVARSKNIAKLLFNVFIGVESGINRQFKREMGKNHLFMA